MGTHPAGERGGGPRTGAEEGRARNRAGARYWDGGKKFAPMTWGALSEARQFPPQERVIRGHDCCFCAARLNTIKYNSSTYNTGAYIRYKQYIQIYTIQTFTYIGQPAENNLFLTWAGAL